MRKQISGGKLSRKILYRGDLTKIVIQISFYFSYFSLRQLNFVCGDVPGELPRGNFKAYFYFWENIFMKAGIFGVIGKTIRA